MTTRRNRRQFLLGTGAGLLALTAVAAPTAPTEEPADALPDGSASKDMITPDAQRAIDRGLAWLAGSQEANGSFGERTQYQGNVAVSSIAALAFMAGGHHPGRGQYGPNVLKALRFVLSKESTDKEGFLHNPIGAPHGAMYSHGFGTLFLAEVHGMIPDRALQQRVRRTLVKAVNLIESSQNREGGWRYQPEPNQADVSVTICQIMALRAARNAGVQVSKSVVDKCVQYVKNCQAPDGGFRYFQGVGASAFARSAAGVCALYCAGVYKGEAVERGLKYLVKYRPAGGGGRRDIPDIHYFYGQYYAAQAMWTAGGSYWRDWFPAVREELLQRMRPRFDGAWTDPTTCNAYATAMACIILQIPNNYLPILQK
jgi:hypothetical protein